MFKCQWCECELSEPEVYCPDCIEALNDAMDLMLEGVSSDTEESQ